MRRHMTETTANSTDQKPKYRNPLMIHRMAVRSAPTTPSFWYSDVMKKACA